MANRTWWTKHPYACCVMNDPQGKQPHGLWNEVWTDGRTRLVMNTRVHMNTAEVSKLHS